MVVSCYDVKMTHDNYSLTLAKSFLLWELPSLAERKRLEHPTHKQHARPLVICKQREERLQSTSNFGSH